ncbi:NAD-binding protein [Halodesulfovibrio marinisediminis]|uniref:NAD-binding protein n=1 Tax=Halodesulfovibrio marinisediminis TaxID=458711 RepID=UPI000940A840|nr:NAD-binding protein [Halodesulfovibrio marinisediminis]
MGITTALRIRQQKVLTIGFGMYSIGELSFLLASIAEEAQIITDQQSSLMLATAILSMLLTPVTFKLAPVAYALCNKVFCLEGIETEPYVSDGKRDHVIIVGAGKVGFAFASILTECLIPFVMIDIISRRSWLQKKGFPIIFGDAAVQEVFDSADPVDAKPTIVTPPATTGCFPLIDTIRSRYKAIVIIASVDSDEQVELLNAYGIDVIINPVLEASLEMTRLVLEHFDIEDQSVGSMLAAYRTKQYTAGQLVAPFDDSEGT